MNASLTIQNIEAWLRECAETYRLHKDELTALDAAIGDGDHGANMARGFSAVPAKLDALKTSDVESLFKTKNFPCPTFAHASMPA
jgi:dihydroxyacetone kinase-like protein